MPSNYMTGLPSTGLARMLSRLSRDRAAEFADLINHNTTEQQAEAMTREQEEIARRFEDTGK